MKVEVCHPFEVTVLPILNVDTESLYFTVNAGKVFNFFNPLNYRNVTCDRDGPVLPKLPFSLKSNFADIKDQVFLIKEGWTKIYIYLYCSFLPPSKWVPGPSFIPIVDKAWIVYKSNTSEIGGETKNKRESNIKYQTYKAGATAAPGETNANLIETPYDLFGNAINYSPIACIEKIDDEWQVNQFLKDNLPITTLFDSSSFELHNTSRYNLPKDDRTISQGLTLSKMKQQVSEIFGIPTANILKGYIRADIKLPDPLVTSFRYKVDITNRLGFENISPDIPVAAPVEDRPANTTRPDPYPDPSPDPYPTPPTPTGVRIFMN
jgi:hypothetical protein